MCRASQGDEIDVHCSQYFVNSSLAPVVLFVGVPSHLRMFLRVSGIRVFSQSRWDALMGSWGAVCRQGPCGPISPLGPRDRWIPPDMHGFHRLVFDFLEVLNGFI